MERVLDFFRNFETQRMIQMLQDARIGDLVHNPWFLGSVAALAVISLVMGWRVLMTTILGLTGFAWLVSYTLEKGTSLDGSNDTLLVFVGGGAVVIGMVIYLLFIKSE